MEYLADDVRKGMKMSIYNEYICIAELYEDKIEMRISKIGTKLREIYRKRIKSDLEVLEVTLGPTVYVLWGEDKFEYVEWSIRVNAEVKNIRGEHFGLPGGSQQIGINSACLALIKEGEALLFPLKEQNIPEEYNGGIVNSGAGAGAGTVNSGAGATPPITLTPFMFKSKAAFSTLALSSLYLMLLDNEGAIIFLDITNMQIKHQYSPIIPIKLSFISTTAITPHQCIFIDMNENAYIFNPIRPHLEPQLLTLVNDVTSIRWDVGVASGFWVENNDLITTYKLNTLPDQSIHVKFVCFNKSKSGIKGKMVAIMYKSGVIYSYSQGEVFANDYLQAGGEHEFTLAPPDTVSMITKGNNNFLANIPGIIMKVGNKSSISMRTPEKQPRIIVSRHTKRNQLYTPGSTTQVVPYQPKSSTKPISPHAEYTKILPTKNKRTGNMFKNQTIDSKMNINLHKVQRIDPKSQILAPIKTIKSPLLSHSPLLPSSYIPPQRVASRQGTILEILEFPKPRRIVESQKYKKESRRKISIGGGFSGGKGFNSTQATFHTKRLTPLLANTPNTKPSLNHNFKHNDVNYIGETYAPYSQKKENEPKPRAKPNNFSKKNIKRERLNLVRTNTYEDGPGFAYNCTQSDFDKYKVPTFRQTNYYQQGKYNKFGSSFNQKNNFKLFKSTNISPGEYRTKDKLS